jgi:hypothetical protein
MEGRTPFQDLPDSFKRLQAEFSALYRDVFPHADSRLNPRIRRFGGKGRALKGRRRERATNLIQRKILRAIGEPDSRAE